MKKIEILKDPWWGNGRYEYIYIPSSVDKDVRYRCEKDKVEGIYKVSVFRHWCGHMKSVVNIPDELKEEYQDILKMFS